MPEKESSVDAFLERLDHPLKDVIVALCDHIKLRHPNLTSHIKWNAPSFCLDGDDRITLKLFPYKQVQVVFHRGAKVKDKISSRLIKDDSNLLRWAANDRAVASFETVEELQKHADWFSETVNKWLDASKD